jgi:asparagine synthase (glutamine-hydrolysing)
LYEHGSVETLFGEVIKKHWALWTQLLDEPGIEFATRRICEELAHAGDLANLSREELIAEYESWECRERQSKFVVNGQRMYEFFGWDWRLPHWDGTLIDFWQRVPFELKLGQKLFKRYLKEWDYLGLFDQYDPFVWRWPLHMMWVVPLARAAGVIFGEKAKNKVYKVLWYYSHYHNHYVMYGLVHYLRTMNTARSGISLQVNQWLMENAGYGELPKVGNFNSFRNSMPKSMQL